VDSAPLGLEAAPLAVDAFVPAAGELRIELPNTWCGRDLVQCTRRGLVDRVDHAGLLHRHSVVFQQGMPGGEHVVIHRHEPVQMRTQVPIAGFVLKARLSTVAIMVERLEDSSGMVERCGLLEPRGTRRAIDVYAVTHVMIDLE